MGLSKEIIEDLERVEKFHEKEREIKEPKRNDLYWAKYWLKMKRKTGCDNFDSQARAMRSRMFGVAWMTGEKTKEDEEVVKILDAILGKGDAE